MSSINNSLFYITLLSFLLVSCSQKSDSNSPFEEFMYSKMESPYVYVFQDSLNPFFERFERIVTYNDPLGDHMLIEFYNADFVLVESFDLLQDKQYQVLSHYLYVGSQQIVAEVRDSTYIPWEGSGVFASSFPGTVDSIMFIIRNKRSLTDKRGTFEWKGEEIETIQITDSVYTLAIDLKNQREKPANGVLIHEYAKGMGKVRIRTKDGTSNLVLKAILTEAEWKTLITK